MSTWTCIYIYIIHIYGSTFSMTRISLFTFSLTHIFHFFNFPIHLHILRTCQISLKFQICNSRSKPPYIFFAFLWFRCPQVTSHPQFVTTCHPQFVVHNSSFSTRVNLSKIRLGPTRKCLTCEKWQKRQKVFLYVINS